MTAECAPWARVVDGGFRYVNDQWGSNKARGTFEQCLLTRSVGDQREIGWTWSWPGLDPSVFAYPSATFGWKPWTGDATDPRLPMQVADIQSLVLHFEVETQAEGSFNLAPEIWFTKARNTTDKADPSLITKELMLWMEYEGGAVPGGRPVDTMTVDGEPYELWQEDSAGKDANGVGWTLLTLKSAETRRKGSLPLHEVLKELVQRDRLAATEFVASIEIGNEVMGGSGTTWVRRLQVELH